MKTKFRKKLFLNTVSMALILMSMAANALGHNLFSQMAIHNQDTDQGPGDMEITDAIELELILQDGVYANDMNVETDFGIVTMSGTTDNILAKERAVEIAKMVKGVRGVIDHIEISSSDIEDEVLKKNIEKALVMDPATDSYEVTVSVNDGSVTLSGEVESWQEKQLSATVAKGVSGVRSLENDITFNYTQYRSDHEMEQDIAQALKWDVRVDHGLIDVEVVDGHVKLDGIVGSAAEHSQAEIAGWITGTKSVDASDLKVERWTRDEDLRKDKYVEKPDAEIKSAVESALMLDPRVLSFHPEVSVTDGKVTLRGEVDNLKAKKAAELDAKNIVGVWSVTNLMKVRDASRPSDAEIESNIDISIAWNPYLEIFDVEAEVINGTVYLTGAVDNYFEKYEAGDIASNVKGVKAVKNNLVVDFESIPYVYDYSYDHYYPYGQTYTYGYTPVKSDMEIAEDIEDQIWWSPQVNLDDVDIKVNSGIAILTGTVDSWSEYYHAEKNAFEGGALTVDNNLIIE